jgi:hypothetical protein
MRVDLGAYRVNRAFIQKWFLEQSTVGPAISAVIMASSLHVPAIVANFYIGEVNKWDQETLEAIERLVKFYGYTEIIGIPEGFPGRKL